MKTLLRTLAILAAALLVVGGLFALRQAGVVQTVVSTVSGRGAFDSGSPPGSDQQRGSGIAPGESQTGQPPAGFPGRGGRDEPNAASLAGFGDVVKNFAIIALSVSLIGLGGWLVRRGRRDQPRPASPDLL